MRIENEFVVDADIDRVWNYLLDVERVAPCMPGAELTEVVDERTWKGRTNVKIGPIGLSFAGKVFMQERDDAGHRVVLKAEGREQRGKGAASAVVVSYLEAADGGTRVRIETDLTITGAVAQYGRGMVLDISQRITGEFAKCLASSLEEAPPAARGREAAAGEGPRAATLPDRPGGPEREGGGEVRRVAAAAPAATEPVKGFRLFLWALWRAIVRLYRRVPGRGGHGAGGA